MLVRYLKNKGYKNITSTNMYITAEGDLPVCLLAHMDTVFTKPAETFYFDRDQNVLWSPDGLGTDDRAGIYIIIMLLEAGYRPSLIFTDMEERGGIGASALIEKYPECIFPDCRALIQLDRQGVNDCVFYDCDNDKFVELIESYGFKEEWGTFTDISIIAPVWEIAAVNLSVGYYHEHTSSELFNIAECHKTIDRVSKMLDDCKDWSSYVYIPAPPMPKMAGGTFWWDANACYYCGKPLTETEGRIVVDDTGKQENAILLCDDCYKLYEKYYVQKEDHPQDDPPYLTN